MNSQLNMHCPRCGAAGQLDIQGRVWLRMTPDGTKADQSCIAEHDWDEKSPCSCGCGWTGIVKQARIEPVVDQNKRPYLAVVGHEVGDQFRTLHLFENKSLKQACTSYVAKMKDRGIISRPDSVVECVLASDSPLRNGPRNLRRHVAVVGHAGTDGALLVNLYEGVPDHDIDAHFDRDVRKIFGNDVLVYRCYVVSSDSLIRRIRWSGLSI